MNMNIGKWIQNKRKENGLSVDDLAKAVGVNRATIYRWESNESTPPASAVSTIAHILNNNPSWLQGDSCVDGVNTKVENLSDLTNDELILLLRYCKLNDTGKEVARNMIKGLKAMFPKDSASETVS